MFNVLPCGRNLAAFSHAMVSRLYAIMLFAAGAAMDQGLGLG